MNSRALAPFVVPGTPSELLLCLMQWQDGGFSLYEYAIHSCGELVDAANASPGQYVIGHNLDDELLLMDADSGQLHNSAEGPLGEDLGQQLGRFRNELCGNKLEWAEGWVSKA